MQSPVGSPDFLRRFLFCLDPRTSVPSRVAWNYPKASGDLCRSSACVSTPPTPSGSLLRLSLLLLPRGARTVSSAQVL